MNNKDYIFLELINSLQIDKDKFFNGVLQNNEEIFIKQVEKLKYYIDKIQDKMIKNAVTIFVKQVIHHKNYLIYKEQKKIQAQKIKKNAELHNLIKKNKESSKALIEKIRFLFINNDFDSIEKLYDTNKAIIDKYQPKFKEYWNSLPRNKINDRYIYSCKNILKNRKIRYLVHFTNVKNLPSILLNGILPRKTLEQRAIKFFFNDNDRLENKLDCISLSVEYPNRFLLNKFKTEYNNKYCIILLDAESVLLNNNNKKYFVYCNAARSDARWWLQNDTLCQDKYLNALFVEENPDSRSFNHYSRTSKQLKKYLPTSEQAEILYQGIIPISYIKSIYFEDLEDLEKLKQAICNKKNILKKFNLCCNKDFYTQNREDIKWEDR